MIQFLIIPSILCLLERGVQYKFSIVGVDVY